MCYQDYMHECCHNQACDAIITSRKTGRPWIRTTGGGPDCSGKCAIVQRGNDYYNNYGRLCRRCTSSSQAAGPSTTQAAHRRRGRPAGVRNGEGANR